ncbi:MAG TPA: ferrochelatase [Bacteroidia bacterium]|nr:ferrochelatase [Bacteroidia bacterium]
MPTLKTGILLVNLGTPDSPSTSDVRKYLKEFLSDPRVIDINPVGRYALVNFIIAPFRSPKSARLYKKIWNHNGSPLLYYTKRQQELLQERLGNEYQVEFAMRYQSPSLNSVLEKFRKPIFKKIIVIPFFPQYASASTGSVQQKIMEIVSQWQIVPEISFVNSFHNHPDFIQAFSTIGKKYSPEKYDHILFSFHGLPERQMRKADSFNHCLVNSTCCDHLSEKNAFCYRAQCFDTARLLAESLHLSKDKFSVSFQSRLGKDPWIKPYSDHVIKDLAKKGVKKLLVFAPAFTADCLETIYEIGVEYDELFKEHGGAQLQLVESLNDSPEGISLLEKLSK